MAFFHEPHGGRQPFFRVPSVVASLILVIAGVHVGLAFLPLAEIDAILVRYAFVPALYSPEYLAGHRLAAPGLAGQVLPFVSYAFLHADWLHLAINMVWLLAVGPPVARRLGPALFLVLFFAAAIGAAGVHLATNWASPVPVIGASGAVAGLMGGAIRILYQDRRLIFGERPRLAPLYGQRVVMFAAVWSLLNVAVGLSGFVPGGGFQLIAWEAHLGGFFAGLLVIGPLDALRGAMTGRGVA